MGKFDRVNLERDPSSTARDAVINAAQSLQASLYQRLRKARGNSGAGMTGWMMVRLAQEDHADNGEAIDAVLAMTASELSALLTVARDARKAMRTPETRELADRVVEAMRESWEIRRVQESPEWAARKAVEK